MTDPYDSTQDTATHINTVRVFLAAIIYRLEQRRLEHDASKLQSPEKEMYDEFTPKLRELTYGSDEYKASLAAMGPALKHHYENNSHHPEHYGYLECDICFARHPRDYEGRCQSCNHGTFTFRPDVNGMSLLDLIEMLCDWKAAGMRHANGNLSESLKINKERFEMTEQLAEIFENTVREMVW